MMSGNMLAAAVEADDGQTGYERCRHMLLAAFNEPQAREAIVRAALNVRTGSGEPVLRSDMEWCAPAACANLIADAAISELCEKLLQKERRADG